VYEWDAPDCLPAKLQNFGRHKKTIRVTDSSVYRIMNQLRPADHMYALLSNNKMQQQPDN